YPGQWPEYPGVTIDGQSYRLQARRGRGGRGGQQSGDYAAPVGGRRPCATGARRAGGGSRAGGPDTRWPCGTVRGHAAVRSLQAATAFYRLCEHRLGWGIGSGGRRHGRSQGGGSKTTGVERRRVRRVGAREIESSRAFFYLFFDAGVPVWLQGLFHKSLGYLGLKTQTGETF